MAEKFNFDLALLGIEARSDWSVHASFTKIRTTQFFGSFGFIDKNNYRVNLVERMFILLDYIASPKNAGKNDTKCIAVTRSKKTTNK